MVARRASRRRHLDPLRRLGCAADPPLAPCSTSPRSALPLTALLAYLNQRFVGLPPTIGVMAIALLISLGIVGLDAIGLLHDFRAATDAFLRSIDFSEVLLQGMLSLLLFAAALHVDLPELKAQVWLIAGLALLGTVASTLVIGFAMWLALPFIGITLPLIHCLLFGALISPTDPVAVIGILKSAGAPRNLETVICGESLFNDGVGVVLVAAAGGCRRQRLGPIGGRRRGPVAARSRRRTGIRLGAGLPDLSAAQERGPVPGGGAADAGGRGRRLRAGQPSARVGPAGDGGRGPDRRQPWAGERHVGDDAALRRHVLGADRRDPQCRVVRADRHGSAALSLQRPAAARRRPGGARDAGWLA